MKKILCSLLAVAISFSTLAGYAVADDPIIADDNLQVVTDPPVLKNIAECTFSGVKNKVYTGKFVTQDIVVKDGSITLRNGADYSVTYKNNIPIGTATLTVTGLGNYTGEKSFNFKITAPVVNAVSGFKASDNTTNSITLSWNKTAGAAGYVIEQYSAGMPRWGVLAKVTGTKYVHKNLIPGRAKMYRIRAYKVVSGHTFFSKYVLIKTATKPQKVRAFLQKATTEKGYTMYWSKVAGATEYRLYKYNRTTKKYDRFATTKNNSYVVNNVPAGRRDAYVVRAVKVYNNVPYLSDYNKAIFASTPAQVKNLKVTAKLGRIDLSWSKVANALGYQIYYSYDKYSGYKLLKQVNNKTLRFSTNELSSRRVYLKVRAFTETDTRIVAGKCSWPQYARTFANKTYDQILNSYSNSNSIKVVNGQGYSISSSKQSELLDTLTCLGGTASFAMLDLDSGVMIGYNSNTYLGTASTVKMPYMLYALNCMEDGDPSMEELLTYKQSDYSAGTSVIVDYPYGTTFPIKVVFHTICTFSDNCGYYMLQDRFGYDGYNKFISSLGCRTSVSPWYRWGVVSAADSTREWIQMYDYLYHGRYANFMRKELKTSVASNFREGLNWKYPVYSKCGWTEGLHHDTAVVEAEHPYVLVCLTDKVSSKRLQRVARAADAIHNEMWNYFD